MKTSSPCARKTFFGSPGLLANPKNFRLIGGGGGGGGGPVSFGGSGTAGATGFGISSACATKIFRPVPVYFICSVAASKFSCRVGSSRGSVFFLPGFPLCLDAGRMGAVAACVDGGDPLEELKSWY